MENYLKYFFKSQGLWIFKYFFFHQKEMFATSGLLKSAGMNLYLKRYVSREDIDRFLKT